MSGSAPHHNLLKKVILVCNEKMKCTGMMEQTQISPMYNVET